jgi:hypothetical protein
MIVAPVEKNKGISFAVKLNSGLAIAINQGFLSFQYHFALQQSNTTPVYAYLAANTDPILFFNLASLTIGLIIRPIIDAINIIRSIQPGNWKSTDHLPKLVRQLGNYFFSG